MAFIHSPEELQHLRHSCLILVSCMEKVKQATKPGVSAADLDALAIEFIRDHGGEPSFLGYEGFKYALCTSINDEIAHGLSNPEKFIPENSLVNLDLGVNYKGMYSDFGYTIAVGEVPDDIQKLMEVTQEALNAGVAEVKAGVRIGTIGYVIDSVAQKYGFGNVYELGGHGVGRSVHEEPHISNYGSPNKGQRLFENQVIAIEPLFTNGSGDAIFDTSHEDGWTVRTEDGSWCAQYEHTVLVTKKGHEILTQYNPEDLLT